MKGAATSSGAAPSRDRLSALRTRGALRNLRAPAAVPESVVRLRRLAGRRLGALRRRLTATQRFLRSRWLRSLQLRVVTTTLVISAMVVTVLGFFLMQQITSDQLQAKEGQAGNVVVTDGLPTANTEPGVDSRPDGAAAQNLMDTIVSKLQAPPEAESSYGVAILLADGYSGAPVYRAGETAGVVTSQIPAKLVSPYVCSNPQG